MKKLSLLFLVFSISLSSQQIDFEKLKNIKTRSIGPAGMSGRVTAIDVVNKSPEIIYAGTASGGLWKSESGGVDWTPIFDKQNNLSIGAVAIQQSNSDVVWAGTGEGNPRNSLTGGYGLYKSLDAGKTWKSVGLEKTRNIHRIIIDKDNPNTVYVGAIGSPWGEHPERGVFKTTDGGKTWSNSLFVNNKTGCADLVVDPTNPNKLIASMWEHRRKPWTFNSGGEGSGIYITYDGGDNWKKLSDKDGLPKGNLGRIGLAIAPSNPKFIYALVEAKKNALYKSEDGGIKWKMINDKSSGRGSGGIGNRPFYYSDIHVDSKNENRIYSVFTYINVSDDGGKSFTQLMPAYGTSVGVHPDHHAWWIHPEDPNYMIDGNDGGLNITRDKGKTWRFAENIPVAQFYHISVDNEFPYNVYGGLQDNGSWVGPAYVLKDQGIRNSYWQELMFGDGFDVVPDPKDARFGYAMSQQGNVGRYDRVTGNAKGIRPTHPDADVKLRFNWNSAISMNPIDNETIYFGSQFVHKSIDKGHIWEIISPDLTTNNPDKQKQHESGGITMDATGAENHCTILAIEPSTFDENLIWAGTDDGNIQLTQDGGKTWENVSKNIKGMPEGSWVAQIRASKFNKGEAYVVVNNYRQFDFNPYLYRTRDFGKTWVNLLEGKDETFGYALSVIQDLEETNLLFLGTEYGLHISIDEGKTWTKWNNSFPNVSTMDLAIHPREHDLIIGTFGRAVYILDDIRPLRALAKEGKEVLDKTLYLFTPPAAFLTQTQQPSGTRFGANAIYNGENRAQGAMITYSINNPEHKKETKTASKKEKKSKKAAKTVEAKSEKPAVKYDSIIFQVFNDKNELIRTIKRKAPEENGVHRMYWYLGEKGKQRPSRRKARENAQERRGVTVLPGSYKIKLHYGNQTAEEKIEVAYDPRVEMPFEVLKNQYDMLKQLEDKMDVAGKATQRLLASKEIVSDYQKRIKAQKNKEKYKDILKSHTEVLKRIDGLLDEMLGKEDKRQGITATEFPSNVSYLYSASRYIRSLLQNPGTTETTLMKNADEKVGAVISKINEFYKTDWVNYKTSVEKLSLSPFEELEELKY
ncbi:WD40/YVTN/BNR-like repeat-containing protein [Lutibacter flavus]|uniref:Sortilin, neurotensin receptor 3 n=1 Tax=Lutibacter flavus TaxID=691689 RepID=A0A238Y6X9_9FLAO|nr:sialidase family protein [Lutibacter flavus]SNR66403.1 Sortilin, neurotensin receptor 3 [Lutibacter flavus]